MQDRLGRMALTQLTGAGDSEGEVTGCFYDPIKLTLNGNRYTFDFTDVLPMRDMAGRHEDGVLGNSALLKRPLIISFSGGYLQNISKLNARALEGYTRLEARFVNGLIHVKASLMVDKETCVEGWWLFDTGCGPALLLTSETASRIRLEGRPQARYRNQSGGVGGATSDVRIRAQRLSMGGDTLGNVVVSCYENQSGALSSSEYVGVLGCPVLSHYDFILDRAHGAVYLRRVSDHRDHTVCSTRHMFWVDRTDICDGWIINGLYDNGLVDRAGIAIGDTILALNGRPVKEIPREEQSTLTLQGPTRFLIRHPGGQEQEYTLDLGPDIL